MAGSADTTGAFVSDVIIVGREDQTRDVVEALRRAALRPRVVADVEHSLRVISRGHARAVLVDLDSGLPGADALAAEVRARPEIRHLGVVVLTSGAAAGRAGAHADWSVRRPIDLVQLPSAISALMQTATARRQR